MALWMQRCCLSAHAVPTSGIRCAFLRSAGTSRPCYARAPQHGPDGRKRALMARAEAATTSRTVPAEVNDAGTSAQDVEAAAPDSPEAKLSKAKTAYLIYNPVAGQEDPEQILGQVAMKLSKEYVNLTVCQTQPDLPAEALAKQALERGADLVVASGGDGTVGAVAGAMIGSGVPLGIVPRGTANAFSVALGIPTHLDDVGTVSTTFADSACDVILGGYTVDVDTALVTTSEVEDYPMILLMGIGYEAEVIDGADRDLKNVLGPLAYVVSGARELLNASNFQAKAVLDGEETTGLAAAITIANAAPAFSILAHGQVGECIYNDGLLEAIGYTATESTVHDVVSVARLFAGAIFGEKPVTGEEVAWDVFGGRYKEIYVECDPPQKVVLDGELLGTTPVTARVRHASLKVLVPAPPPAEDEKVKALESEQELIQSMLETGSIDT